MGDVMEAGPGGIILGNGVGLMGGLDARTRLGRGRGFEDVTVGLGFRSLGIES